MDTSYQLVTTMPWLSSCNAAMSFVTTVIPSLLLSRPNTLVFCKHTRCCFVLGRYLEIHIYIQTCTFIYKRAGTLISLVWYACALCLQAQTWCDDAAYLLANQLVDKFQSKEGAQAALRDIEKLLEGAPSMLSSGLDIVTAEYEAVITPHFQVS